MASSSNPILAQIELAEYLGVVNDQLRRLYSWKDDNDNQYFSNYFPRFLNDTAIRFAKIEALLNNDVVDFFNLAEECYSLIGSSATIGAFRLQKACKDMQQAADDGSKPRCLQAFNVAKIELSVVKPHLDAILQLERGNF